MEKFGYPFVKQMRKLKVTSHVASKKKGASIQPTGRA